MRKCFSLFFGIWIGTVWCSLALGNPVYSVTGIAVGSGIDFESKTYDRCGPSEMFEGFTLCAKRTDDTEQRGSVVSYDGLLHSDDGTVVFVSRYQEPAYWRDGEVQDDIEYYSHEIGEQPAILKMPTREGFPNGMIATWGKIVLEPVDGESRKILATGKNPKIGVLIDFIGNFERSTKNDLPVYRVSGGAGFVWSASWDSNGRGTLRMLAIDASALPSPVNLTAPNPVEANQSDSNPLTAFAHKSLESSLGTGFFVSAEGHILTTSTTVRDCRDITSSHGSHITKIAVDETSDLALLKSSENRSAWASFRGGSEPRVTEPVMTVRFPIGTISALTGLGNDRRMMQISTPTQLGNSGSPLLDQSGDVVGIIAGKMNAVQLAGATGDITQNANFAVGLGTIQSFLDDHAVPYVLNDSTETKNYANIAAEAMRYAVLLECAD